MIDIFFIKTILYWPLTLICAFLLDCIAGDPYRFPHPVRGIGFLIDKGEMVLRKLFCGKKTNARRERLAGTILVVLICFISFAIPALLLVIAWRITPIAAFVLGVFIDWTVISARCLRNEAVKVYKKITAGDLDGARQAVSMIVGRDTKSLDTQGITKATVETVSENLADGIIAPLLYLAIGGPALGMLYKAINTMDSMIAYKNSRYINFGRSAAKLDDIAGFIPARLGGLIMVAAAALLHLDAKNAWRIFKRDRLKHDSPNSAHCEAACAGALDVELAGGAFYGGVFEERSALGNPLRPIDATDILWSVRLMYISTILFLFAAVIINTIIISGFLMFMLKSNIYANVFLFSAAGTHPLIQHGGDTWTQYYKNGKHSLDFSINISPLGVPNTVQKAIRKAAKNCDIYPDPLCRPLCYGIAAQWYNEKGIVLLPQNIVLGNGADDLIYRIVRWRKPKTALLVQPSFSEYEKALCEVGCRIKHHYLLKETFLLDETFLDAISSEIEMIFLCNPNNPTGLPVNPELLEAIIEKCDTKNITLVIDECFNEFLDEPQVYTAAASLKNHFNLYILKAFTKIYAMAGVRLGYIAAGSQVNAASIAATGQTWAVSSLAQEAGLAALSEKHYIDRVHALVKTERAYLKKELAKLQFDILGGEANYIFVRIQDGAPYNKKTFFDDMLRQNILVRSCSNFQSLDDSYYRFAVRTHKENVRFIYTLKELMWLKLS